MAASKKDLDRKQAASDYLALFYPFHYRVGFAVEKALRGNTLTQHQTVILWIIHSEGGSSASMRRKDIETRIAAWFDLTSSAVSKALRSLAREDLRLLSITEDPRSGREKLVTLTREGERHIEAMVQRSEDVILRIIENMSPEEIRSGIRMLSRIVDETLRLEHRED